MANPSYRILRTRLVADGDDDDFVGDQSLPTNGDGKEGGYWFDGGVSLSVVALDVNGDVIPPGTLTFDIKLIRICRDSATRFYVTSGGAMSIVDVAPGENLIEESGDGEYTVELSNFATPSTEISVQIWGASLDR
jgi:hypothetical protein